MWLTDGRIDGRADRQADGPTPYHNTSEVSLRAHKKSFFLKTRNTYDFLIKKESVLFDLSVSFKKLSSMFYHEKLFVLHL